MNGSALAACSADLHAALSDFDWAAGDVTGSWWEVMEQIRWKQGLEHMGWLDDQLGPLLRTMWAIARMCVVLQGRLWQAVVREADWRGVVCAPSSCGPRGVTGVVLARHPPLQPRLASLHPSNTPAAVLARAELLELSPWEHLRLDFVVAGVDKCGTTSLFNNLRRHPEIAFTNTSALEDNFFEGTFAWRMQPFRSDIENFNRQWESRARRTRVLGLHNPALFRGFMERHALASVPGLRALLILCDPVGRLEKLFLGYYFCGSRDTPDDLWPGRWPAGHSCDSSVSAVLRPGHELFGRLGRAIFGSVMWLHLRETRKIFGRRLLVIHQDDLRERPLETYNRIASFLGVRRFSANFKFFRYNSRRGHRTDLCHNLSTVRELQGRLRLDYEEMEALLGPAAPQDLRLRRTRCGRPAELVEPEVPCNFRGRWRCAY